MVALRKFLLPWNKCFVTILLREGRNLSAERDYPTG
jgi:hypothetical protein